MDALSQLSLGGQRNKKRTPQRKKNERNADEDLSVTCRCQPPATRTQQCGECLLLTADALPTTDNVVVVVVVGVVSVGAVVDENGFV